MTEWEELDRIIDYMETDEADVEDLQKFKAELIDKINEAQRDLQKNEEDQGDYEEAVNEAANDKDGKTEAPDKEVFEELERQWEELDDRISELNRVKNEVDRLLAKYKVFDKDNCFANIRFYMKQKDEKIGQIEKKAGVRKGYMSRLDKPDNTTDPSIQFVATAARMLDVSLDELLYGHPTEMSEAESVVRDYLRDLLEDTKAQKIKWFKERDGILDKLHNLYSDPEISHPLLFYDEHNLDSDGTPMLVRYGSLFYPDKLVDVDWNVYWANMPGMKNVVYLVPCVFEDDEEHKRFFEVYLTDDEGKATGVCNTRQVHPSIMVVFNELFKAAMASSENVFVDDGVRNIINQYRKNRANRGGGVND